MAEYEVRSAHVKETLNTLRHQQLLPGHICASCQERSLIVTLQPSRARTELPLFVIDKISERSVRGLYVAKLSVLPVRSQIIAVRTRRESRFTLYFLGSALP